MAKLGWGTPPLVTLSLGVIIEIPGQHRDPRRAAGRAARRRRRDHRAAGQLRRRDRVRQASASTSSPRCSTRGSSSSRSRARWACWRRSATTPTSCSASAASTRRSSRRRCRSRRRSGSRSSILNSRRPRIRVEGYFAVTTNTAQFGARVELLFGFDDFSVEGHLGFDALFQFSPFYFVVEISASVSVKAFGVGLFSVRLRFELDGPDAVARAGHGLDLAPVLRHRRRLRHHLGRGARHDAAADRRHAAARRASSRSPRTGARCCPPASNLLVSLRTLDPAQDTLVLHPVGMLRVTPAARAARPDHRQGRQPEAADAKQLQRSTVAGGGLAEVGDVDEQFAPAQFQDLDDADEAVEAGVRAASTAGVELSAAGAPADVGRDGQAGRPLRADHRSTSAFRAPPALPAPVRRCCSRTSSRGAAVVAIAAVAGRASQAAAVRRTASKVGGETFAVASTRRQPAARSRRSAARRGERAPAADRWPPTRRWRARCT